MPGSGVTNCIVPPGMGRLTGSQPVSVVGPRVVGAISSDVGRAVEVASAVGRLVRSVAAGRRLSRLSISDEVIVIHVAPEPLSTTNSAYRDRASP